MCNASKKLNDVEVRANVRRGGSKFSLSVSLPVVFEEHEDTEWVDDKVVNILNSNQIYQSVPNTNYPKKIIKKQPPSQKFHKSSPGIMQRSQQGPVSYHIAVKKNAERIRMELNAQNLAIHDTLQNDTGGVTMKAQRYFRDLAHRDSI